MCACVCVCVCECVCVCVCVCEFMCVHVVHVYSTMSYFVGLAFMVQILIKMKISNWDTSSKEGLRLRTETTPLRSETETMSFKLGLKLGPHYQWKIQN